MIGLRLLVLAAFLCGCAEKSVTFPPRGKYEHVGELREEYDRFTDSTTIWLSAEPLAPRLSREFYLSTGYKGDKVITPPESTTFTFTSLSDHATFSDSHAVTFLLDDSTRLSFPKTKLGASYGDSVAMESIYVEMPTADVARLAAAHKVEMKIGFEERTFSPSNLNAIRDFASRLAPEKK